MKICQPNECDCKTCKGGGSAYPPGSFGGWKCMCPCHNEELPNQVELVVKETITMRNDPDEMTQEQIDAAVDILYPLTQLAYDELLQDAPWKNQVAEDLNRINGRLTYELDCNPVGCDITYIQAALRIVQRVAEFEKITLKK